MRKKFLLLIIVLSLLALCVGSFSELQAQEDVSSTVDLEDAFADDVSLFDDKEKDLFADFEKIIEEDLDMLFEDAVTDEDIQEQRMLPRLSKEEIIDATDESEMIAIHEKISEFEK